MRAAAWPLSGNRLLWARQSDETEAALWARAIAFEIGGAQCLAPCAADMLIHVCAHGAGWAGFPPVRWVVDAALLLRKHVIDWDYLCLQSARLGLNIPISATLEYLRSAMRAPIPEEVLRMLARGRARAIDRLLYETEAYSPEKRSVLTALRVHIHIARSQLARTDGLVGYWRYFSALRSGRSLGEMAAWVRGHLAANRGV